MSPDQAPNARPCILCGGRGGWWTLDVREPCSRCSQTGWEPSPVIREVLAGHMPDGVDFFGLGL